MYYLLNPSVSCTDIFFIKGHFYLDLGCVWFTYWYYEMYNFTIQRKQTPTYTMRDINLFTTQ